MNLLGMPNPAARSPLGGVATFSKMPPKEVASQLNDQEKEGMGGEGGGEEERVEREKEIMAFPTVSLEISALGPNCCPSECGLRILGKDPGRPKASQAWTWQTKGGQV